MDGEKLKHKNLDTTFRQPVGHESLFDGQSVKLQVRRSLEGGRVAVPQAEVLGSGFPGKSTADHGHWVVVLVVLQLNGFEVRDVLWYQWGCLINFILMMRQNE